MNAKDKHIDRVVGYVTAGDLRGAHRYYVENRMSHATYIEALRKAKRVKRWFEHRDASLCIANGTQAPLCLTGG